MCNHQACAASLCACIPFCGSSSCTGWQNLHWHAVDGSGATLVPMQRAHYCTVSQRSLGKAYASVEHGAFAGCGRHLQPGSLPAVVAGVLDYEPTQQCVAPPGRGSGLRPSSTSASLSAWWLWLCQLWLKLAGCEGTRDSCSRPVDGTLLVAQLIESCR